MMCWDPCEQLALVILDVQYCSVHLCRRFCTIVLVTIVRFLHVHVHCILLQVKGSLEASVLCLTTIGTVKLSLRLMDDVKVCIMSMAEFNVVNAQCRL